jgi:hypothetical protein
LKFVSSDCGWTRLLGRMVGQRPASPSTLICLQLIKSFSAVSLPVGNAASLPHDLAMSFVVVFVLLLWLVTRVDAWLCCGPHALVVRDGVKWSLLRRPPPPRPHPSHTLQTALWQERLSIHSPLADGLYILYMKRNNFRKKKYLSFCPF